MRIKRLISFFFIVFLLGSLFFFTPKVQAATTTTAFSDGFEAGNFGLWDQNGATTWTNDGGICNGGTNLEGWASSPHSGTYYAGTGATGDGELETDNIDLSGIANFGISFWYANDDGDAGELALNYWDGAAYDTIKSDFAADTEDTWTYYSAVVTDSQYFDATFRVQFVAACGNGEAVYIDDFIINKTTVAASSFTLAQTVTPASNLQTTKALTKQQAQTVAVTAADATQKTLTKIFTATTAIIDTFTDSKGKTFLLPETIEVLSNLSAVKQIAVESSEFFLAGTAAIMDTFASNKALTKTLPETIAIASALETAKEVFINAVEAVFSGTIEVTAGFSKISSVAAALSETVSGIIQVAAALAATLPETLTTMTEDDVFALVLVSVIMSVVVAGVIFSRRKRDNE